MINFVGAGPGAVDLITVRGRDLLEKADVIIYAGSLVNPDLLSYAKKDARIYNSAEMTLEEVTDVMLDADSEGKNVVRLHTGDQSIYGAIREQMDILDANKKEYASTPGVSACFGAAAALDLEYTLPNVSQTLIITRMEGVTGVPEKESIEALAAHGASMAIYLSSGMLEELSRRLVEGGYREDTPAALAFKVTHPDEKIFVCTVATLADTARHNGITKTAVVLVGDVITHSKYDRSKLYDPAFSTGYRNAKDENTNKVAFCFNDKGRAVIERLNDAGAPLGISPAAICTGADLHRRVAKAFSDRSSIIFVGAVGIAIRMITPFVNDKLSDSCVIAIDDDARFVIPLLSGHVGGANKMAVTVAKLLDATPVITTSTDVNGAFSADVFAVENHLAIRNREGIRTVSAKALEGKSITLSIKDYPPKDPVDIIIADETDREYDLLLSPKNYVIGIGMKKDKDAFEAEKFITSLLSKNGIDINDVHSLATIDVKEDEHAIRAFSQKYRIPVISFEASVLERADGDFTASEFVKETVGVDNVCERAAALAAGPRGVIVCKKVKGEGITAAIAKRK